jgi:hypothetical protein
MPAISFCSLLPLGEGVRRTDEGVAGMARSYIPYSGIIHSHIIES